MILEQPFSSISLSLKMCFVFIGQLDWVYTSGTWCQVICPEIKIIRFKTTVFIDKIKTIKDIILCVQDPHFVTLCFKALTVALTSQQVYLLQVLLYNPFCPCQYTSHPKNNSEWSVEIALEL